jgi:hypothetical protein
MKLKPMIILHHAVIYTQDPGRPIASALVIEGDRILEAGEENSILEKYARRKQTPIPVRFQPGISLGFQPEPVLVDLDGRAVIPGLTDAHIHLEQYALGLQKIDCETDSQAECLERVRQRARQTPPGNWILGHGWNQNNWAEGFGSVFDLDAAAPGHPVYLTAKSLHAAWANSAALRLAGLTAASPDPAGGRLGRDASGQLNGILFESAMELVASAIPEPSPQQVAEGLKQAQQSLWRMGLTGVHDFDRRRCFSALQLLKSRGELGLRVVKSIPLEDLPHAAAVGLRSGFGDDWLRIGCIKAFADGALGPRTAAMLQPYEGEAGNRGMLLLDAEELFEKGRQAVESGLSLAVHAIGDLAVHQVLNAFQHLQAYEEDLTHQATLRHRVEHVQLIHAQDVHRLGQLGILASMQPIHAPSDMLMAERYWGERAALAYAWKSQLQHGARLVFGSDAPVESPNPFWGLHAAVTRQRGDGSPSPLGWYPEQRLTLVDALAAFTIGPAYAAGMEDRLGRLAPGYLADLLVLDRDPFKVSPWELRTFQPAATMIGGEWKFVY